MKVNEPITIDQLLIACLDGVEQEAPTTIPRTPECLSYAEFEAHADGLRFLSREAMRHVNCCPDYCQPILETFRRQFNVERIQFKQSITPRLAAHTKDMGASRTYEALVESRKGEILGPATIVVTDGPFLTENHNVVFRMSVAEPRFELELLPLRVSMADQEEQTHRIFTFDLPTQAGEIIKMKIPQDLFEKQRWKEIDATAHLPMCFVVSPLGQRDLVS